MPVAVLPWSFRVCLEFDRSQATHRDVRAMTKLSDIDEALCESSEWDSSDLSALYINWMLKRSPEISNTQACKEEPNEEAVG